MSDASESVRRADAGSSTLTGTRPTVSLPTAGITSASLKCSNTVPVSLRITCDYGRCRRAALFVNAAKYTEAGGEVELSVERGEDEATVRIRETGIGIAPDVPHVFELFVQANPASQRADAGLGIGLALVHSLVECHGGRVTAASGGLQHGSEFTVCLPMPAE